MLVYNICIFGAVSGAGIFGAQFYGKGDHKGVRDAFRFKIVACGFLAVIITSTTQNGTAKSMTIPFFLSQKRL